MHGMRRWAILLGLGAVLATASLHPGEAQQPASPALAGPPHAWLYGTWTGGIFPATETQGAACLGQPSVVFTRDVILRSSPLDITFRQRLVETATTTPTGVDFRLVPVGPTQGGRVPPGVGFGCSDPNTLRVERRGDNEIVFPDCEEFPSPLKRCTP
jgi:hypothetical protein